MLDKFCFITSYDIVKCVQDNNLYDELLRNNQIGGLK